jgi:hypothetical protein
MLHPIGEKTLVPDGAHAYQRAMDGGPQKFFAQTCESRRVSSTEHVRRNREIQLID